jgi:hypothetical protein
MEEENLKKELAYRELTEALDKIHDRQNADIAINWYDRFRDNLAKLQSKNNFVFNLKDVNEYDKNLIKHCLDRFNVVLEYAPLVDSCDVKKEVCKKLVSYFRNVLGCFNHNRTCEFKLFIENNLPFLDCYVGIYNIEGAYEDIIDFYKSFKFV